MGLLDSFEKGLERAVNSAFAKTFRSGLQPVEIASALRSELDKKATVVTRDRVLVPNAFMLRINPSDRERMDGLGSALVTQLEDVVRDHAAKQGYTLPGAVRISISTDESVAAGTLAVDSTTTEERVSWQALLEVDGRRYPISSSRTIIGRGTDADVTVNDPGTSRKHVEVLWDGERAVARDLGSTNGSKLDGAPLSSATLSNGQTITIGRTSIIFRLVPGAAPSRPAARGQLFDYRGGASS